MARRKSSRFQRFKESSKGVSVATGLGALGALLLHRGKLANNLLKVSSVASLASVIPSRKGVKRVFGKKSRRLSKRERLSLVSKGLGAAGDVLFLGSSRVLPSFALLAAQAGVDVHRSKLKSRRRGARSR